jgi:DNA-binding CsgD family transcriptional regulator
MFGALLTKSKLTQRFDSRACRLLHQIESPLRAAARRIARLGHMTQERDVLRQVLSARRGAFALWGPELCLMWLSPEAENCFRDVFVREGVQELALIAARQTKLAKSVSEGCMLGRPHEVNARTGEALTVQFCRIRAADERPWLLAELKDGKDVHETLARLTSAELRVLRLLVRGASNREICGKLFVSQETVKTHVARILRKLGVSSRSKAASLARDAGLVEA